ISQLIKRATKDHPFAASLDLNKRISESFTFGNFAFDFYQIHQQEGLIVHQGTEAAVEIRFLVDDEEESLIKETLQFQWLTLAGTSYRISKIETVPLIDFQDVMAYRCLCPIS